MSDLVLLPIDVSCERTWNADFANALSDVHVLLHVLRAAQARLPSNKALNQRLPLSELTSVFFRLAVQNTGGRALMSIRLAWTMQDTQTGAPLLALELDGDRRGLTGVASESMKLLSTNVATQDTVFNVTGYGGTKGMTVIRSERIDCEAATLGSLRSLLMVGEHARLVMTSIRNLRLSGEHLFIFGICSGDPVIVLGESEPTRTQHILDLLMSARLLTSREIVDQHILFCMACKCWRSFGPIKGAIHCGFCGRFARIDLIAAGFKNRSAHVTEQGIQISYPIWTQNIVSSANFKTLEIEDARQIAWRAASVGDASRVCTALACLSRSADPRGSTKNLRRILAKLADLLPLLAPHQLTEVLDQPPLFTALRQTMVALERSQSGLEALFRALSVMVLTPATRIMAMERVFTALPSRWWYANILNDDATEAFVTSWARCVACLFLFNPQTASHAFDIDRLDKMLQQQWAKWSSNSRLRPILALALTLVSHVRAPSPESVTSEHRGDDAAVVAELGALRLIQERPRADGSDGPTDSNDTRAAASASTADSADDLFHGMHVDTNEAVRLLFPAPHSFMVTEVGTDALTVARALCNDRLGFVSAAAGCDVDLYAGQDQNRVWKCLLVVPSTEPGSREWPITSLEVARSDGGILQMAVEVFIEGAFARTPVPPQQWSTAPRPHAVVDLFNAASNVLIDLPGIVHMMETPFTIRAGKVTPEWSVAFSVRSLGFFEDGCRHLRTVFGEQAPLTIVQGRTVILNNPPIKPVYREFGGQREAQDYFSPLRSGCGIGSTDGQMQYSGTFGAFATYTPPGQAVPIPGFLTAAHCITAIKFTKSEMHADPYKLITHPPAGIVPELRDDPNPEWDRSNTQTYRLSKKSVNPFNASPIVMIPDRVTPMDSPNRVVLNGDIAFVPFSQAETPSSEFAVRDVTLWRHWLKYAMLRTPGLEARASEVDRMDQAPTLTAVASALISEIGVNSVLDAPGTSVYPNSRPDVVVFKVGYTTGLSSGLLTGGRALAVCQDENDSRITVVTQGLFAVHGFGRNEQETFGERGDSGSLVCAWSPDRPADADAVGILAIKADSAYGDYFFLTPANVLQHVTCSAP